VQYALQKPYKLMPCVVRFVDSHYSDTRQTTFFLSSVARKTLGILKLGKEASLPRVFSSTQQIIFFSFFCTHQNFYCLHVTLGDVPRVAPGIPDTRRVRGFTCV
jgi:hypothetical protein